MQVRNTDLLLRQLLLQNGQDLVSTDAAVLILIKSLRAADRSKRGLLCYALTLL